MAIRANLDFMKSLGEQDKTAREKAIEAVCHPFCTLRIFINVFLRSKTRCLSLRSTRIIGVQQSYLGTN
jgi:hypothetical protein